MSLPESIKSLVGVFFGQDGQYGASACLEPIISSKADPQTDLLDRNHTEQFLDDERCAWRRSSPWARRPNNVTRLSFWYFYCSMHTPQPLAIDGVIHEIEHKSHKPRPSK